MSYVNKQDRPGGSPGLSDHWKDFQSLALGQAFDAKVAEKDGTLRIVCLDGESALVDLAGKGLSSVITFGLRVVDGDFVVNFDDDTFAFDADVVVEPGVVGDFRLVDIDHSVEGTGFLGIAVVVTADLSLKTNLWPGCVLILRVEVDSCVGVWENEDLAAELEVFERFFIANIEEVTARLSIGDEASIFYVEGTWGLRSGFPAIEGLAVKDGFETGFGLVVMSGVVLGKKVATEVTIKTSPDRVYVVGVVLCTVLLEEPVLGLNPIVMTFSWLKTSGPGKVKGIGVEDGSLAVNLLHNLGAMFAGVGVDDFLDQALLAAI